MIVAVTFLAPEAGSPPFGLSPGEYYVGTRAASLGRVSGRVVASIFGVINPSAVVPGVERVFNAVEPDELVESRLDMAVTVLRRVLGVSPGELEEVTSSLRRAAEAGPVEGHPLYAAVSALPLPDDRLGRLWRAADLVREHRGDAHVNAWRASGLQGAEINVLTELWRGQSPGTESRVVNAWRETDIADALAGLDARGLVRDGAITDEGRRLREEIEFATSAQQEPIVRALGEATESLLETLGRWAAELRAALPPPYWWDIQEQQRGSAAQSRP